MYDVPMEARMNVTGQDDDAYALRGDSEADTVTKGLGKLKTSSI